MKKFILLILAIIIAGGVYYYFFVSNNAEVATTSYEYIKIEKGNIKKTVSATGKIIPTSTLTLSSEISGKIVEINKDFNEQINKGEVLAIFDQNPFTLNVKESQTLVDISKSKLKQKQASLEKAKSELKLTEVKAATKLKEDQIAGKVKWEQSAVDQMKGSWKDELILICLLAPATLVFFPGMTEHIEKGFVALQQLPDYYKHLLYIACSASFGIKAGKGAMGLIKKK